MRISPTPQIDASLLPRTYRTSIGNRIFLPLVASANAVGGLLGMVYFGLGHEMKSPGERLFFVLVSFLFVVLGSYVLVYTFKSKIVLYADRIEWQGIKSARSLRREDIAGWRIIPTQYMSTLEVRPRSPGIKKLKVSLMLKRDEVFEGGSPACRILTPGNKHNRSPVLWKTKALLPQPKSVRRSWQKQRRLQRCLPGLQESRRYGGG